MANEIELRLSGLAQARKVLQELPRNLRRRALRNSLAAAARVFRDEARRRAPVLKLSTFAGSSALRRGVRKAGTLRRALAVRTSKRDTKAGNVGVFVNVRPLKNGGARNPNDPYYWRWQEFGWTPASRATGGATGAKGKRYRRALAKGGAAKAKPGAAFLRGATSKSAQAIAAFERALAPQVQRFQTGGAR